MKNIPLEMGRGQKKGSILIWTTLLGLLLTSVFFAFSLRQRKIVAEQRKTALIQGAKAYLESYADLLEKHPMEIVVSRTEGEREVYDPAPTFDGILVKLTQKQEEIIGAVDTEKTVTYSFGGSIYVEWNQCGESLAADLLLNGTLYPHEADTECQEYDDLVGPLSVSKPFEIRTQGAPFSFRIRGSGTTLPLDNRWHLEMEKELEYGQRVRIERVFTAS